jgi:hypothetical protein
MWKQILRVHKVQIAIFIYLVIFSLLHFTKPKMIYNDAGGFRPFGLGYRHKTVIPIWGVAIVLAIFCYLAILSLILYG